jgi:hypothetical protein
VLALPFAAARYLFQRLQSENPEELVEWISKRQKQAGLWQELLPRHI